MPITKGQILEREEGNKNMKKHTCINCGETHDEMNWLWFFPLGILGYIVIGTLLYWAIKICFQ
jgi:hypothetical protein